VLLRKFNRRRLQTRRGVAVAELVFCLPIVLLLAFGTMEICAALFLRETLAISAYEGARVGVKRRATQEDAYNAASNILAARGITGAVVDVNPSDFSTIGALDPITITVRAPVSSNSPFFTELTKHKTLSATVRMVREFDE
jgi:TadE-like protein